ncbi:LysR family transcriptional regulator [Nakamurella lactea]|uniref:LysR family transcriptional regulator n=1 Tax=Nakamurella lactea TaxID=459515 RepID=UPI0003FE8BB2|nr:LysR family transcriptional regulator [Nakamurella lactea]
MLDTHRLRIFRAVVATGSVAGAAGALGYTPSAVSQHLAALQRETNLALVERRGRGIVPTAAGLALAAEAGLALAAEAGDVLERLAALEAKASDLRAGRLGSLTVSYVGSAGATWIPPVVAALSREFPLLRLDLRLIELAGERPFVPDLEIYVAEATSLPITGYRAQQLLEEPYLVVMPDGHPLAHRVDIDLAELEGQSWVDNDVSRGPCRQIVLDACAAVGFAPSFRIQAQDYPSAIAFVAAGVGITVLPRLGTVNLPPGLSAVPVVNPAPTRRIMVRIKDSVSGHPAVARALELLTDCVERHEAQHAAAVS